MKRRHRTLLAIMAAIFLSGICQSAFAQEKKDYPMPDFSPLSPWYEVKKAEYDLHASPPVLRLVFVIKKESRPWNFDMRFEDAEGSLVEISTGFCAYYMAPSGNEMNTPIKCDVWVADRKEMQRVKTVRIVQKD